MARIAVITSDVFVRRLTPALSSLVHANREFRVIDLQRPEKELLALIRRLEPAAIITEWLPHVTDQILSLGYPTVIADSDDIFPGATVSLDVDDTSIGAVAADFYLGAGYRHLACVHLPLPYGRQRLAGFRARLAREALTCADFLYAEQPSAPYMESWQPPPPTLRAWLRRLPRPAAVFAVHDPLASLIAQTAALEGLRVPDDISVLGANNDELVCGLGYPPLSSVSIPWNRLGALAGQWAQHLLEGKAPPSGPLLIQPGPVVVRQSTTLTAVDDPTLRRALQYIRRHCTPTGTEVATASANLTVATLCATLRISRRQLERKFATTLHSTPWEMICRLRIETAKRLLAETDLPMAHVAERSGFGDPERLSVVFRRHTTMTPSAYRQSTRHT
ncbi:AraC family transcriptional regulator [Verrucomicrobia bacterium LW23]|nr:AraC family transcriptional regulator [Verrucomicrobia bacterium LW23]